MYKNPGGIKLGSLYHAELIKFAHSIADRLGISHVAALGQLIKLDDKMIEAMDSEQGMSALVIETNIDQTSKS